MTAGVVFHENIKEMTMSIDQHIEELRAELRHGHPYERSEIQAELAKALAERDAIWDEAERLDRAEPPH